MEQVDLFRFIVDRVSVGILTLNKQYEIVQWNKFMEIHSGKKSTEVNGRNIFECFPELPKKWLVKKIQSVFILKNFAFTSWQQRRYLFKFRHNRSVTGGADAMRQDCTFLPVKDADGNIDFVCITLFDVTDASIDHSELIETKSTLTKMSTTDGLTKIYNRRFLEETIEKEFSRVNRYGGVISFILFDIDHFKNINDSHGHLAGDEVLRQISSLTGELTRTSDIFGRYGGEEFAVIAPGIHADGAIILAERIRDHVEKFDFKYNDTHIPVTISLGVTEFSESLKRYEELIKLADDALYYSKQNGRNRVSRYLPDQPNPSGPETPRKSTAAS